MKKLGVILILVLFISMATIVQAQDNSEDGDKSDTLGDPKEKLGELGEKAREETESKFNEIITIPSNLQLPARIIFGLKEDHPITLQHLILLIAAWIIFFIIIKDVLKFFPILNGKIQNVIGSIVVTLIVAISGGLRELVIFFFSVGDTLKWLEALGPFQIILWLLVFVAIFIVLRIVLDFIKRKLKLGVAEGKADSVDTLIKVSKITATGLYGSKKD
jgi:hypothetical protein